MTELKKVGLQEKGGAEAAHPIPCRATISLWTLRGRPGIQSTNARCRWTSSCP